MIQRVAAFDAAVEDVINIGGGVSVGIDHAEVVAYGVICDNVNSLV